MGAFQEKEVSAVILLPPLPPTRLLSHWHSTQNVESFNSAADSAFAEMGAQHRDSSSENHWLDETAPRSFNPVLQRHPLREWQNTT
jgi:hypothetical protein